MKNEKAPEIVGDETVDPKIVDVVVLTVCGVIVFAGLAGAAAVWMAITR